MPSFMKEYYGDPKHPEYDNFKKLSRKGCPMCGNRLFQKGGFAIGLVMCESVNSCCREYEYDGHGGWKVGPDGKAGVKNTRFVPPPMPKYSKHTDGRWYDDKANKR
jgi:hypothetical protein